MSAPTKMTWHARVRVSQRVGDVRWPDSWLRRAVRFSVPIPQRIARDTWQPKCAGKKPRKWACQYRMSASVVLLCVRDAVVTVLPISCDDLATALVWLMTGCWCGEAA